MGRPKRDGTMTRLSRNCLALSDLFCLIETYYDPYAPLPVLDDEEAEHHYKTCARCGVIKKLSKFYKASPNKRPYARQANCIACVKKYQSVYNSAKKEVINENTKDSLARGRGFINYEDYLNQLHSVECTPCPLCENLMTNRGYWEPVPVLPGFFTCKKCSIVLNHLKEHQEVLDFYTQYVGELLKPRKMPKNKIARASKLPEVSTNN